MNCKSWDLKKIQRQRSKASENGRETADKTSMPSQTKVVTTLTKKKKRKKCRDNRAKKTRMAERQYKVRMACDVRQRVPQTEWHLPTNRWWGHNPLQNFLYNQQLTTNNWQPTTNNQQLTTNNWQPTTDKHNLSSSMCNQRSIKLANQIPSHQPILTLWRTDNLSDSVCNHTRTHNNNISGSLCKQRSLKLAKQRLHFILRRQTVGIPLKSLAFNGSSEPCGRSVASKLEHLQFLRCFFATLAFGQQFYWNKDQLQRALKTPYSLLPYIFWTVSTFPLTWYHPIYAISIQTIE